MRHRSSNLSFIRDHWCSPAPSHSPWYYSPSLQKLQQLLPVSEGFISCFDCRAWLTSINFFIIPETQLLVGWKPSQAESSESLCCFEYLCVLHKVTKGDNIGEISLRPCYINAHNVLWRGIFSSRILNGQELEEKKSANYLIMAILHYFQLADFKVSSISVLEILAKSFPLPFFSVLDCDLNFLTQVTNDYDAWGDRDTQERVRSQCEFIFISMLPWQHSSKRKLV